MRAMMKAREVIALSTAHPQGSRTERRAAIKAKRTAQRQASREFQGLSPAVIVIAKRRKAEQSARKAAMRVAQVSR
jgi:hypothetical protein